MQQLIPSSKKKHPNKLWAAELQLPAPVAAPKKPTCQASTPPRATERPPRAQRHGEVFYEERLKYVPQVQVAEAVKEAIRSASISAPLRSGSDRMRGEIGGGGYRGVLNAFKLTLGI